FRGGNECTGRRHQGGGDQHRAIEARRIVERHSDSSDGRADEGDGDQSFQSANSFLISAATVSAPLLPSSVRSVGPSASSSAGTCSRVTCSASVPSFCLAIICTAVFEVNGPR